MRGNTSKSTHWYYVLVFQEKGPVYVTKIGEGKTAYWDREEKPLLLSRDYAEQMALGLCLNGYNAIAITSLWKVENHPYNYKDYEIEWKEKENDKEGTTQDKSRSTNEGL